MLTRPALEEFRELFLRGLRRFRRGHFVRFTEILARAKPNKMPGKKQKRGTESWLGLRREGTIEDVLVNEFFCRWTNGEFGR